MDNNEYHQFSFERPHSKLSELQFTPLEKRSFFSQYDTDMKPSQIASSQNATKKTHYPHHYREQKNRTADGSPFMNPHSPDTHSFLLPPDLYLGGEVASKHSLKKKLLIFAILSLFLTIAELILGFIANSMCVMIDSIRLFYIFKSFFIPYLAMIMHEIAPNKNFTFGYQRFEVLVSLLLITAQWGVIIGLIIEATKRWFFNVDICKEITMITAFVGLICNLILRKILSYVKSQESFQEIKKIQITEQEKEQGCNSCIFKRRKDEEKKESIAFSQEPDTIISENKKDFLVYANTNMKKMKKTLDIDTEYLEGNESQEDPFPAKESIILPSFSISRGGSFHSENSYADNNDNIKEIIKESLGAFILIASFRSIKENILILMEGAPAEMDVNIIGYNLRQLNEVTDLHNLHIWKIGPGKIALSVHLKAQKTADLLWKINNILTRMGVYFMSVQIEEDNNIENELICEPQV